MYLITLKVENSRTDSILKAEFSDSSPLIFSAEYLPEGWNTAIGEEDAFPATGRELLSGEEEAFRYAAACYRAETAALKLIARAEQNSLGLSSKLERRGFESKVVKAVVSHLLDRNLLDDTRYAELWIRSRLSAKKAPSPRWLLVSLGKKGIDRNSSRDALLKVLDPDTEYALLLKFLEISGFPGGMEAALPRANLKYEGFSYEVLERYTDLQENTD